MTGPLVVDIQGTELTEQDREVLQHPLVGGVILFSRNFENKAQLTALTHSIKALVTNTPLFIAVDQEGGRVQRFINEFIRLPSAHDIGLRYEHDKQAGLALAQAVGFCMAAELIDCGVDFSFAPVLDVDHQLSDVIGSRSFNRKPAYVIDIASSFIDGMRHAGMIAVGKHFPGHGAVKADSHYELPIDTRSAEEIYQQDLIVFSSLIRKKQLASIMTAHIVYSEIDSKPVTFSSKWLQSILRKELEFTGVIFSDDLAMAGAATYPDMIDRVKNALHAGCDYLLICNDREQVLSVIDQLTYDTDMVKPNLLATNITSKPLKQSKQFVKMREMLKASKEHVYDY